MLGKRYVGTLSVLTLVVFSALLLTAGLPAYAQTESVLYNLSGDPGAPPEQGVSGLTSDGAGNFYGTTAVGGAAGEGAVFEISPNGSGGWYETVLHSLCSLPNCTDGANPYSNVIFDGKGNLYGTAAYGGADNSGVVFELSPAGRSWNETVLYSFANDGDGAYPTNNLIMDRAGNLYGPSGGGVFELSPSGANWTERSLDGIRAVAERQRRLESNSTPHLYGACWSNGNAPARQGGEPLRRDVLRGSEPMRNLSLWTCLRIETW
jgi:uncharacterized repeat protein (TIGR03803 family)